MTAQTLTNEERRKAAFDSNLEALVRYYNGALDELRQEIAGLKKERDAHVARIESLRRDLASARRAPSEGEQR